MKGPTIIDGKCSQCGRSSCQAVKLGRRAARLGFPESMRKSVTAAQEDCDTYRHAKVAKN